MTDFERLCELAAKHEESKWREKPNEVERLAGYIKHREPHFSRDDAMAAAHHAIQWLKSRQ